MSQKFSLFPGCIVTGRYPHLEKASRLVASHFNIELIDMNSVTCCPEPFSMQNISPLTHLSIAARNISVTEEMGLDMMVLCGGCLSTLFHANTALKNSYQLRNLVNDVLGEAGRKYKGVSDVKHIYQILIEDVGIQRIRESVKKPLREVKVAAHYGCHLMDIAFSTTLDEPNQPMGFEKLIEAIGAQNVPHDKQHVCCGGPMRDINDDISRSALVGKLDALNMAGADCIAVLCPLCYMQFDSGQLVEQRKTGREYNIPTFYYTELLALALGYSEKEIGLTEHRITKGLEEITKSITA